MKHWQTQFHNFLWALSQNLCIVEIKILTFDA